LRALRKTSPFTLFVGSDAIYRRARPLGADGIVSGIAAALPELIVGLESAIKTENHPQADFLDARLQEFIGWVEKFPATIAIKQAAVGRGWKLDHSAVPFDEITTKSVQAFHEWFKDWFPQVLYETSVRT
jgi:dihydrodipicolinate synthase/N-acetylneuraminate lyase